METPAQTPEKRLQFIKKELHALHQKISPGYWTRTLSGSFYGILEYLLYGIVLFLLFFAYWFDANAILSSDVQVNEDLKLHLQGESETLSSLNYLVKFLSMGFCLLLLFGARMIRSLRKALFKLADVS